MSDHSTIPPELIAGRYAIERELGRGGMATVYLAQDRRDDTPVALKLMRPELAAAMGAERFTREVQIVSGLRHPNVLPILDAGSVDGLPFLVTPYVPGESLAHRLKREGQLPIAEAVEIACSVADALTAAHAQGFVHRDVKPSNILLDGERAYLADFGIARAVDVSGGDYLTATGMAVGTVAYMSPEQAGGVRVDGRSDVYSLGCVLYEMLAGSPPFGGRTTQALISQHAVDPVPSIRTVRPTVSSSVESSVRKALAKVPADRYAGAGQFRDALRRSDTAEQLAALRPVPRARRWLAAALLVVIIGVLALASRLTVTSRAPLDPNRVMVYPLVVSRQQESSGTIGEDVATMIGTALDGTGPLRWIDGWHLLGPAERGNIRNLTREDAAKLARSRSCGYYVMGRVVLRGDSADVLLELNDVAGDTTVSRSGATAAAGDAWRAGLLAVNGLLPALIPGVGRDLLAEWADRKPAAIAGFLLGEAAFRRVHLVEALEHYRAAVAADSLFGLAAIRGAQAASWNHRSSEAGALIRVAARQALPPRFEHFARGYAAYLEGAADSATSELRRALDLDPQMAAAWAQLGEVHTHLLPFAGNADSVAEHAFDRAFQIDSSASNLVLHLIEARLRRGDVSGAEPLVRRFLAGSPDTVLAGEVEIMDRCVRDGPLDLDWRRLVDDDPLAVLLAANQLKGGGAQIGCAKAAFAAVVRNEGANPEYRWFALLGLQSALLAQGRITEAIAEMDAPSMRDEAASIYLLNAPLFPELASRADGVARDFARECGQGYTGCANPVRLWEVGLWEAHIGRPGVAAGAARELGDRARQTRNSADARLLDLMARSANAHATLARGDSGTALKLLEGLLRTPVPSVEISWHLAAPRAGDRLKLAELLYAKGEFQRALDVAQVIESASPSMHLMYLPASLRLRAEAAEELGDAALAASYRSRLEKLRAETSYAPQ